MSSIPDITETGEWVVETTLREHYSRPVELQFADAKMRLQRDNNTTTWIQRESR
ncbi:MAG: hypothetical protein KDI82_05800 [Gammaproteobacteria bacterium]|nr:hypothetical protein [Gammaproteobacteria bacterium]